MAKTLEKSTKKSGVKSNGAKSKVAAVKKAQVVETVEAVIISGPRKGDIVTLQEDELKLSSAEEALLDSALKAFQSAAQRACSVSSSMDALLADLREANRRLREPV